MDEPEGVEEEGGGEDDGGEEGAGKAGRKRSAIVPLVIVGLVGLGGGGALGGTTLGAKVGEELARRQVGGASESGGGEHGDEYGSEEAPSLHIIDNLVVNPAQSAGTRFLLTSIAIQVVLPDHMSLLAARDIELRDTLIMVLGSKTVEELSDITLRSGIVKEIFKALEDITGPEIIHRVFLPQFVIQ